MQRFSPFNDGHEAANAHQRGLSAKTPRTHRRCAWWAAVVCVVLSCLAPTPVQAQYLDGIIAGPISTGRLLNDLQRINASEGQQRAIMDMHDAYTQQYVQLLVGPVEAFCTWRDEDANFYHDDLRPTAAVRQTISKLDDVRTGFDAIERRFFDAVSVILTDEQNARLLRIRRDRQRDRLQLGSTPWNGYSISNTQVKKELGAILDELNFDPATLALLTPIIEQYERRLTSVMADNHASIRKQLPIERQAMLDAQRMIGELLGLDLSILDDPEMRRGWHHFKDQALAEQPELAQQVSELDAGPASLTAANESKRSEALADLRKSTHRRIRSALEEKQKARWERAFYLHEYRKLGELLALGGFHRSDYDAIDGLTAEQRDVLETEILPMWDAIDEKIISIGREFDRLYGEQAETMSEGDVRTRAHELRTPLFEEYNAAYNVSAQRNHKLLTEAQRHQMSAANNNRRGLYQYVTMPDGPPEQPDSVPRAHRVARDSRYDEYCAMGVNRPQLILVANVIGADRQQRVLIDDLYATYANGWRETVSPLWTEVVKAMRELWQFDVATQTRTLTSDEALDSLFTARRRLVDATRRSDDELFEAIAEAMGDAIDPYWLQHARQLRQRIVATTGGDYRASDAFKQEADLMALLFAAPPSPDERAVLAEVLADYGARMTSLFDRRYEAALRLSRAQAVYESISNQFSLTPTEDLREQRNRAMMERVEQQAAFNDAEREIVAVNDAYLE